MADTRRTIREIRIEVVALIPVAAFPPFPRSYAL